jgi:hypothetical protein
MTMSLSKIAVFAFALAALVSSQLAAQAGPFSRFVSTGMGAYETGVDQAKGNIR